MDYFVNSTDYVDAGTTATSVISPDGGSHALYQAGIYPARGVDATGLVMPDASPVITHAGVRLRYTAPQTVWLGLQPTAAIDRNGNQITMSSSGWFDTLERRIPGSPFPDAANPNPIEPGVWTADWANCPSSTTTMARVWDVPDIGGGTRRFKFCYAATTLNPSFGFTNVQENPVSATLLTTIVMPNLTSWTFSYDNFGDIARIVYPTGGSIAYTYATRRGNTCTGEMTPGSRWVATRTVDANDGTGGHRWVYTYDSTAGTTTVSDPLGNDVVHTIAAPVAGACTLFDVRQKSYQGSASSGTLLRTVDQQYGGIPSPVQAVAVSADNVVPTQGTTT